MKNLFYLLPILFTPFFFIDAENFYNEDTKAHNEVKKVYNEDTKAYEFTSEDWDKIINKN